MYPQLPDTLVYLADSAFSVRKNGPGDFTLLVASANALSPTTHEIAPRTAQEDAFKLKVQYGDFKDALTKVVKNLNEAKKYTANGNQTAMINGYIESCVVFICINFAPADQINLLDSSLAPFPTIRRRQSSGFKTLVL